MSQNQMPESPQPIAEEKNLVGVATHDLFSFFERWEAIRDSNWSSGDYTKQSLGSRTDTMLKELREVMIGIQAAIENIVVPTGEDSGVILLSDQSPTHIETANGHEVSVYDHDHFSPLGDALVALHRMCLLNDQALATNPAPVTPDKI